MNSNLTSLIQANDDESLVVQYLQDNPHFFDDHEDLLSCLVFKQEKADVVSFQTLQVNALQKKTKELESKLNKFVDVAHDNDSINQNIQQFCLDIMDCESLEKMFDVISKKLEKDFNILQSNMKIVSSENLSENSFFITEKSAEYQIVKNRIADGAVFCGRLNKLQIKQVFTESNEMIKSLAIIPLKTHSVNGYLVIGSDDGNRFHPGIGTDFLDFLGKFIAKAVGTVIKSK